MEVFSTDILIIGSGLAGVVAALESERSGLQTLLLGKFGIGMGTNSSIANGGFTTANSRFSKEDHLRMTLETGKGLNVVSLVKSMVEQGPGGNELFEIPWSSTGRECCRILGRPTRGFFGSARHSFDEGPGREVKKKCNQASAGVCRL